MEGVTSTAALPLARCTVCGGTASRPEALGTIRCTECGTVRAPAFAPPEEIYRDGYASGGCGPFGGDVRHPRLQAFLLETGAQRVRWLEARGGVRAGAWLDVGAGTGEVLAAARDAGWRVAGAEPIDASAAMARDRGLDVRSAMLADAGFDRGAWDVVSAFHVLEHLEDPVAFVAHVAGWARPGGLVLAEVPNWDSTLRDTTGEGWMHLRPLEHLTHFTPATLRLAFERAGLEVVAVETPTFRSRSHTLAEATEVVGRPAWRHRLARVSPRREVLGERHPVPGAVARAVLGAAAARDLRRGRGMVVRALGRVAG